MTLCIDAHQHYWRLDSGHGDWPSADLAPIFKDFTPDNLIGHLRECGIDGTVAVQSNPHLGDTHFLLELADRHDSILGVVGWIDLTSTTAVREIARLAGHPKFKGVRAMLQALPAHNWIEDGQIQAALDALVEHDLSLDVLVLPKHLDGVVAMAERNRALRIVIDHAGKPDIASRQTEPWSRDLQRLAALPNVYCKLSGLLTEAAQGDGAQALQPYMDNVLESFGTRRVMWGSDWPVINLASDYFAWWAMTRKYLDEHETRSIREGTELIMGMNACLVYRIDCARPAPDQQLDTDPACPK
ncbi:amidohydrolase family protein [Pseudomonas sp. R151218B TE3479]